MVRTTAHPPALLQGHLTLSHAMKRTGLPRPLGEQVTITVGPVALDQLTGSFDPVAGLVPRSPRREPAPGRR